MKNRSSLRVALRKAREEAKDLRELAILEFTLSQVFAWKGDQLQRLCNRRRELRAQYGIGLEGM